MVTSRKGARGEGSVRISADDQGREPRDRHRLYALGDPSSKESCQSVPFACGVSWCSQSLFIGRLDLQTTLKQAVPIVALFALTSSLILVALPGYEQWQSDLPAASVSRGALLFPTVPPRSAPPFSSNVMISDDTSLGNQNEVSMTIDTEGRIVAVWNDDRLGDFQCGRSYSHDGGDTWSATVLHMNPSYDFAGDPVVAADDAGNIYFVCMSASRPPNTGSTLEVMTTSDGGVTWSPPVDIGLATGEDDKPWIAAYGNGTVFVGWRHIFDDGRTRVAFRVSADAGQSWSPNRYLSPFNGVDPGMDVDDSGALHTVFWENGYIVYRRSEDLGQNFTPAIRVSPAGEHCAFCTPRSSHIPGVAVDRTGDRIYVFFSADMGNITGEDINLVYSHDRGGTWRAVSVNDDKGSARQFMPFVDVDLEGRVHVIWSDLRSGEHEIYYTNSTDGGDTFIPNVPVTDQSAPVIDFQGDYQVIVVDHLGIAHVAWCDTRNDNRGWNGDIYYARGRVANSSLSRVEVTPARIRITADETQRFTAQGYDRSGNPLPVWPAWQTTGGVIDSSGLYSPFLKGNFTVYANQSGVSGSATVEVIPGSLVGIGVSPPFATLTADDTQLFRAEGFDARGNPIPVPVAWNADNGTISGSGLFSPWRVGTWTVTAVGGGARGTATVMVSPGRVADLDISPTQISLRVGENVSFMVDARDAKGNPIESPPVTWVLEGHIGTLDDTGYFLAEQTGSGIISASVGDVSASANVEVLDGAPLLLPQDGGVYLLFGVAAGSVILILLLRRRRKAAQVGRAAVGKEPRGHTNRD